MQFRVISILVLVFFISACKHTQKSGGKGISSDDLKIEETDRVDEQRVPVWAPKDFGYKPSKTITNDLIHTKIDIRFDWEKQYAISKVNLTLRPYFAATDSLTLDAKGFTINRIAIVQGGNLKDLKYSYDSLQIKIQLDRSYTRNENYEIFIDYVAKPNELTTGELDEAITDRKGLYFINPDGKDPHRPKQIWTQGETEYSSCWFPTIEANNQRTTQETIITVENKYKTLSNGILLSSVENPNGTRTDHWKMDQGHAPYLFMMAIGDFAIVKDKWRGIDVSYYVEPKYEKYARMVFGNTPEMIEFFSQKFGVDYPWQKYSQVVVRDFVSGAMENTTATIHMEALQHDHRYHLDETEEDYISHELSHHWFGDYVTCESWANLPLNESFATFAEVLWREYKYGIDEAEHHLSGDFSSYFAESQTKREPLIRFYGYQDPGDVFDRHSYSKGGCVLNLLRKNVGDDAFFASLKYYLKQHAFSPVEIDELRMAFEDVTGKDMHWFFDQWFMKPGHPTLEVRYEYSNVEQMVKIHVKQAQDLRYQPVYQLPFLVELAFDGGKQQIPVTMTGKDTVFKFPANNSPVNVILDSDVATVGVFLEDKPIDYWIYQFKYGKAYRQKIAAAKHFEKEMDNPMVINALKNGLNDPFWVIRDACLEYLSQSKVANESDVLEKVKFLATKDPKANVRATAVSYLIGSDETNRAKEFEDIFLQTVKDSSYNVLTNSLVGIYRANPAKALEIARQNQHLENSNVSKAISEILVAEKQPDARSFIINCIKKEGDATSRTSLLQDLYSIIGETNPSDEDLNTLKHYAQNDPSWYVRFSAVRILAAYRTESSTAEFLSALKMSEKNKRLREIYQKLF